MNQLDQLIYYIGYVVIVVVVGMIFVWGVSALTTFIPEKIVFTILDVVKEIILISVIIVIIYKLWIAIN